jgi:transcriptional regulator with XRE-family HTH domain/Zn-dependent peptidase ImmA (M78 family)
MLNLERKPFLRFRICKVIWHGDLHHMNASQIGQRIKSLREAHRVTQADFAAVLGVNARQSVSQIETGSRQLTAEELVKTIQHFGVTLDALTNPFLLSGKHSFSWRQNHVPVADLDAFEARAGEWIGAYRELNRLSDVRLKKLRPRLGLTHGSSFEDAVGEGEALADELELGDTPAHKLADTLQDQLGILVLMVDALEGVSGAACRLPELDAVLINRHEPKARRNSDLAHEFFHILTWDQMKPDRIESSTESWDEPRTNRQARNQRIEQLADNFASGLLMPSKALDRLGEPHADLVAWLTAAAAELGVSSRALKWRLVNAKRSPAAARVSNDALSAAARVRDLAPAPLLFSKPFIETIARAIEAGHLSGGRASQLLCMPKADLGDLCDSYGVSRPVEI